MPDVKISALPASTTPLAGTEVLPIVQSATTRQVSVANLTAGRSVGGTNFIPSGSAAPTNGMYLPAANSLGFSTNSTNVVTIDALGNLGLGVTPSPFPAGRTALEIGGSTTGNIAFNGNATNGYQIWCNSYFTAGSNFYYANGLATNFGSGSGSFFWNLAPNNTSGAGALAAFTQAMTLNASGGLQTLNTIGVGNATPSTSGAGITFPATQSASSNANTLDDYEEGTWNAVLSDGTNNATMSTFTCSYTKIGRTVTYSGLVTTSSVSGLSGALRITGLPFTVGNNSYSYGGCACTYANDMVLVAGQAISAVTETNTTYLTLYKWSAITGTETLQNTNWSNSGALLITGTYLTT